MNPACRWCAVAIGPGARVPLSPVWTTAARSYVLPFALWSLVFRPVTSLHPLIFYVVVFNIINYNNNNRVKIYTFDLALNSCTPTTHADRASIEWESKRVRENGWGERWQEPRFRGWIWEWERTEREKKKDLEEPLHSRDPRLYWRESIARVVVAGRRRYWLSRMTMIKASCCCCCCSSAAGCETLVEAVSRCLYTRDLAIVYMSSSNLTTLAR